MFLPITMEFNRDYTGERYREIARAMGVKGVDDMTTEEYRDAAIAAVKQLSRDVGIAEKNEKIREEDLDQLAADAYADACRPGNPRDTSVEEIVELYKSQTGLAVVPMQDVIGLDDIARMNVPSTVGGNWKWREVGCCRCRQRGNNMNNNRNNRSASYLRDLAKTYYRCK